MLALKGDKERAVGLPVSPLMDRNQTGGMTRSQVCVHALVLQQSSEHWADTVCFLYVHHAHL